MIVTGGGGATYGVRERSRRNGPAEAGTTSVARPATNRETQGGPRRELGIRLGGSITHRQDGPPIMGGTPVITQVTIIPNGTRAPMQEAPTSTQVIKTVQARRHRDKELANT